MSVAAAPDIVAAGGEDILTPAEDRHAVASECETARGRAADARPSA
jgi:hypothetical protein